MNMEPLLKNELRRLTSEDKSRRLFIQNIFSAGLMVFGGGIFVAGCNSETKKEIKVPQDTAATAKATPGSSSEEMICGDYSNVSKEELDKRKKLGYEEKSSDPERECIKCNLFIPKGKDKECGGCILFKGPVNNVGSCTYWAEQVS